MYDPLTFSEREKSFWENYSFWLGKQVNSSKQDKIKKDKVKDKNSKRRRSY